MSTNERKLFARAVFAVRGIDCVTCGLAIKKRLKKLNGVKEVGVAPMLNKVFIDYDDSRVGISEIMKAVAKTGYSGHLTRTESSRDGS